VNIRIRRSFLLAALAIAGCGYEADRKHATTIEEYDYLTALENPAQHHVERRKQLEADATVRKALEARAQKKKAAADSR
jgi:hypothetical protein